MSPSYCDRFDGGVVGLWSGRFCRIKVDRGVLELALVERANGLSWLTAGVIRGWLVLLRRRCTEEYRLCCVYARGEGLFHDPWH